MIEAKPETNLRSLCLEALLDEGYCGPNYSLDDISAFVSMRSDGVSVSFWDMSCFVSKEDRLHKHIVDAIEIQQTQERSR